MSGRAERFVPHLFKCFTDRGWWLKKNTDWSAIINAKEVGVDYNLSLTSIQIEVKNSNKDGVLSDRPSDLQRQLLDKYGGFIFLVMWDRDRPRMPGGGDGYLVPWPVYKKFDEDTNVLGKSVRRSATPRAFGVDDFLSEYKLEWRSGGFHIPYDHPFWDEIIARASKLSDQIGSIVSWRACQGEKYGAGSG